jgi:hypothetical protein
MREHLHFAIPPPHVPLAILEESVSGEADFEPEERILGRF